MKHLLSILALALVAVPFAQAQAQVQARWDGKQLALNPVWTRVADVFGEAGSVESVEFSPDSRFLASGTKFDNTVIIWRTSDGTEVWRQTLPQEIERVGWSPNGEFVASVSEDFMARVFRAEDGTLVHELPHDSGIDGLAWSHNGRFMATGAEWTEDADGRHGYLRLYAMPGATLAQTLDLGDTINSIDFSSDDTFVLGAGHGAVAVWRLEDGTEVQRLTNSIDPSIHFISARFSPDDQLLVAGDNDGNVHLWDWETGELLRVFDRSGHKIEIVEWTPDGQYLATAGNDPFIRLFRTADMLGEDRIYTALQVFAGDQAEYLHFNALGSLMASAHQDGLIRLWVFMSEDPTVNARRHEMVKAQQRAAAQAREDSR
ncbi:MAG: hypothetical protein AAGI71_14630 [Bacteroidota bacterium]